MMLRYCRRRSGAHFHNIIMYMHIAGDREIVIINFCTSLFINKSPDTTEIALELLLRMRLLYNSISDAARITTPLPGAALPTPRWNQSCRIWQNSFRCCRGCSCCMPFQMPPPFSSGRAGQKRGSRRCCPKLIIIYLRIGSIFYFRNQPRS